MFSLLKFLENCCMGTTGSEPGSLLLLLQTIERGEKLLFSLLMAGSVREQERR